MASTNNEVNDYINELNTLYKDKRYKIAWMDNETKVILAHIDNEHISLSPMIRMLKTGTIKKLFESRIKDEDDPVFRLFVHADVSRKKWLLNLDNKYSKDNFILFDITTGKKHYMIGKENWLEEDI